MQILFAAPANWPEYETLLPEALKAAGIAATIRHEAPPEEIDAVIYAPSSWLQDFTPYTRCGLVQNLWAGVERIVGNATLTQPLCRMIDPGLAQGMVEYCTGWTLRAHLGMDAYPQNGEWRHDIVPPLASGRGVTILGMGELGRATAEALAGLGFDVAGWSQSGRPVAGIPTLPGAALGEIAEEVLDEERNVERMRDGAPDADVGELLARPPQQRHPPPFIELVARLFADETQMLLEERLQAGRRLEAHHTGGARRPAGQQGRKDDQASQPTAGSQATRARHRRTAQASRW